MNILADENIPLVTIRMLREMNHNVLDIRGTRDEGITDEALWSIVKREHRLLITTDKYFAQYRDENHHGILVIRLKQPNKLRIHQRIMQAIKHYSPEDWQCLLVVMRDTVQSVWKSKI